MLPRFHAPSAPFTSCNALSLRFPTPLLLLSKQPCSLSRPRREIPDAEFGVHVIYIYIYLNHLDIYPNYERPPPPFPRPPTAQDHSIWKKGRGIIRRRPDQWKYGRRGGGGGEKRGGETTCSSVFLRHQSGIEKTRRFLERELEGGPPTSGDVGGGRRGGSSSFCFSSSPPWDIYIYVYI